MLPLVLISALSVQGAAPSAMLAPSQPELVERLGQLRTKLERADALGTALARVQNRAAQLLASGTSSLCAADEPRSLAARAETFGVAYRDAAQAARADADRLEALLSAPSLAPLLHDEERRSAQQLVERAAQHGRRYQEALAWQRRLLAPAARGCELPLSRTDGLPSAGPAAPDELQEAAAIAAVGGGQVCPAGVPADGRVVVVAPPKACYSASEACACEARPVLPGAVLGPGP